MNRYLEILYKEIYKAVKRDEVPVAALIVNDDNGKIIAKFHNSREKTNFILNHAEIKCIQKANKRLKYKFLSNCTLYVTLEPCEMCRVVIKEARIKSVYYLLSRSPEKKSYSKTIFQHWNVEGEDINNYQQILSDFFKKRR